MQSRKTQYLPGKNFVSYQLLVIPFILMLQFVLEQVTVYAELLGFAAYIIYAVWILKKFPGALLKYFTVFLGNFQILLSLVLIECAKADLPELGTTGKYHGAFFVFLTLTFCGTILLMCKEYRWNRRQLVKGSYNMMSKRDMSKSGLSRQTVSIVTWLALIFTVYMFSRVVTKPYFLLGYERHHYAEVFLSSGIDAKRSYMALFMPVAAIAWHMGYKKRTIAYIGVYTLYLLWIGEKFSGLMGLVYVLMISFVGTGIMTISRKTIKKVIMIVGCCLAAMVVIIYISRVVVYGSDFFEFLEYLEMRLSAQGQMWWSIYDKAGGKLRLGELGDELYPIIFNEGTNPQKYNFGIYKMMHYCAPSNIVTNYLVSGSRFTSSTEASVFYYFGLIGVILWTFLDYSLKFYLTKKTVISISDGAVVESIMFMHLLNTWNVIAGMSEFRMLTEYDVLLAVFLVLVMPTVRRRMTRTKNSHKN